MRGIDTQVRQIRRRIFKEIAELAYESENLIADMDVERVFIYLGTNDLVGIDPAKTSDRMMELCEKIKASKAPKFKAGQQLKDAVNDVGENATFIEAVSVEGAYIGSSEEFYKRQEEDPAALGLWFALCC